jgi:hypothetical protein
VAYDTYLQQLLIAEVLVVVHLASDEGVGTGCHCFIEQEVLKQFPKFVIFAYLYGSLKRQKLIYCFRYL